MNSWILKIRNIGTKALSLLPAGEPDDPDSRGQRRFALLFCFLTALSVLLVCTRSSPLYPMNDWDDVNCFFTVGKGMFNGQVVYRDLYEQKGILLYFLHGLCWLVSHRGFIGVFILELIACTAFLYYAYRTMRLWCSRLCILSLPILFTLICNSNSFINGDSAEELCFPLLAFGLYIGLRAVRTDTPVCLRDAILIGITSGAVLWIKFTMLGMYLGWFWVPAFLLIRKKDFKGLLKLFGGIVLGVALITLPFFLYFAYNGALSDWFEVYFYNNIFLYHPQTASWGDRLAKIWREAVTYLGYNWGYGVFISIGLVGTLLFRRWREKVQILLCFLPAAFFVFYGVSIYLYYVLILAVFAPIGMVSILRLLSLLRVAAIYGGEKYYPKLCRKIREKRALPAVRRVVLPILSVILCLGLLGGSFLYSKSSCPNANLLFVKKEELPQFRFAEIINRKENATLLNYAFLDGGFYTAAGILPNCRFFCRLNMDNLPEMMDTQNEYVREGKVDFVITCDRQMSNPHYLLVDTASYPYRADVIYTYYLYEWIG